MIETARGCWSFDPEFLRKGVDAGFVGGVHGDFGAPGAAESLCRSFVGGVDGCKPTSGPFRAEPMDWFAACSGPGYEDRRKRKNNLLLRA